MKNKQEESMNEMKSMTKVIALAYAPFRYNVASRTDSIMFYKQDLLNGI